MINFTSPSPHEEIVAFGLPPGRLGVVAAGAVAAALLLHLPSPEWLRGIGGGSAFALSAALAWVRLWGVPSGHWAWRLLVLAHRNLSTRARRSRQWRPVDGPGQQPSTLRGRPKLG